MRLATPAAAALLFGAAACSGATFSVQVGAKDEPAQFAVEAPNLRPGMPRADSTAAAAEAPVPPLPAGPPPAMPPPAPLAARFPHLATPPRGPAPVAASASSTLDDVLGADASAGMRDVATLTGANGGDFVAVRDGKVLIEPLLRTYDGATLIVRLFDADGNEVTYSGGSLLEWRRPDDRANAPLEFQGREDAGSMFLEQSGDYSPKRGLTYEVPLRRGQRVTVEVAGKPASDSRVKLSSDALEPRR